MKMFYNNQWNNLGWRLASVLIFLILLGTQLISQPLAAGDLI